MKHTLHVATLLACASVTIAPTLHGQATFGVDAGVHSRYVWRGLTVTSDPVLQQDLWVSYGGFTGGVWGNLEVVQPGVSALSLRGPDNRRFGEIDYWVGYGRSLAGFDLSVGGVYYAFPGASDGNTVELYADIAASFLPVKPKLAAYYDVDEVQGAYFEGSVGYALPLPTAHSLEFGVLAGFSAGQEANRDDPGQAAYFATAGSTHLDFSVGTDLGLGFLSVAPAAHVLVALDGSTRVIGLGVGQQDNRTKVVVGVSVGWSGSVGRF